MNYEVFLLSRTRKRWRKHDSSRALADSPALRGMVVMMLMTPNTPRVARPPVASPAQRPRQRARVATEGAEG